MIMSDSRVDREALHPADLDAIKAAVEKRRAEGYPPLTDRQKMIIESAFKTRPFP